MTSFTCTVIQREVSPNIIWIGVFTAWEWQLLSMIMVKDGDVKITDSANKDFCVVIPMYYAYIIFQISQVA